MNRRVISCLRALAWAVCACLPFFPNAAVASSTGVVISQVYGGGGNSGAVLRNDFIELFNAGQVPVSLSGWSVQYASSGGSTWQVTNLPAVTLQPGQYYLIQQAVGEDEEAFLKGGQFRWIGQDIPPVEPEQQQGTEVERGFRKGEEKGQHAVAGAEGLPFGAAFQGLDHVLEARHPPRGFHGFERGKFREEIALGEPIGFSKAEHRNGRTPFPPEVGFVGGEDVLPQGRRGGGQSRVHAGTTHGKARRANDSKRIAAGREHGRKQIRDGGGPGESEAGGPGQTAGVLAERCP
jgi:hypothetical protein